MTYCTQAVLSLEIGAQELILLTDHANTGAMDTTVIAKALSDADAKINSYLTVYPLPLAVVPANFERMAGDIARYFLYKNQMIDPVRTAYTDAVKYLEQVGMGKISLGADVLGAVAAPASAGAQFVSNTAVFGRDGGY